MWDELTAIVERSSGTEHSLWTKNEVRSNFLEMFFRNGTCHTVSKSLTPLPGVVECLRPDHNYPQLACCLQLGQCVTQLTWYISIPLLPKCEFRFNHFMAGEEKSVNYPPHSADYGERVINHFDKFVNVLNTTGTGDAYIRHWTGWSLVPIMNVKWNVRKITSVKFLTKFSNFHSRGWF